MLAFYDFYQFVEGIFHLGLAQPDNQPVEHSLVDSSIMTFSTFFLFILGLLWLRFALLKGLLENRDDLNNSLTLDVCRIHKNSLIFLLHFLQLFLLFLTSHLDMLIEFLL